MCRTTSLFRWMQTNPLTGVIMTGCIYLLSACVSMTPDYHPPDIGAEPPPSFQHAASAEKGLVVGDDWWREFGDQKLNRLVADALAYNWDIRQAADRILELHALYYRATADAYPSIDIDASYDRRRTGGARIDRGTEFSTYQISAPAFYEIDLWGRLASARKAAWQDILQAEENRKSIAQSVVADTVRLYLELEALERRLQVARRSVESFRLSADFVTNRYRRGLISILDVRQARRILAQAEALVPEIERQLGDVQQQLMLLVGQYPGTSPPRRQPEAYYRQLPDVPPGLPSDLLLRRPDIRVADARLKALNERVGEAIAARFPTVTLTGRYGYSSEDLNNLIKPDQLFWNLTAGMVHPLFDAGNLKAAQKASEARYRQQVAEYADVVLNAFKEVEAALLTRQKQLERRKRLLRFLEEARATQRVAEDRYIRGLTGYLDVLDAQQTRFQAEENMIEVDLALMVNRVALYRAIGGGWALPEPIAVDTYFNVVNY